MVATHSFLRGKSDQKLPAAFQKTQRLGIKITDSQSLHLPKGRVTLRDALLFLRT